MTSDGYTWDEIDSLWLNGSQLAMPADNILAAFNSVEAHFGRGWMETSRTHNGAVSRGTYPTLEIVSLGQFLLALGDTPNTEHLLSKVRTGDPDARAELIAIYLLRSGQSAVELVVEPSVIVGSRTRKPDCAMRVGGEDWTYIEVTQTNASNTQKEIMQGLRRLTDLVDQREGNYSLEIVFKRDPTDDEMDSVVSHILTYQGIGAADVIELEAGLGTAYWTFDVPDAIALGSQGELTGPGLGMAMIRRHMDEKRAIDIRWPFSDTRAKSFIHDEARQLPKESPGLIVIDITGTIGAIRSWRPLIERCFQPEVHTRVSGVCLFSVRHCTTPSGAAWQFETLLLQNPHARKPLPSWIAEQLKSFSATNQEA